MTTSEHIELDALQPGMPVVVDGQAFGSVQNVVPQADRRHVLRLIVRRHADSRLVAIPIEWVRGIRDGALELWVTRAELDGLPEYVPPISASEARDRVERALHEHPATSASGIRVTDRDGTLELRGEMADRAGRSTASSIARSVPASDRCAIYSAQRPSPRYRRLATSMTGSAHCLSARRRLTSIRLNLRVSRRSPSTNWSTCST